MRIRKHAAKLLLGSTCPPPQQYSPPPPPADDEYDLQCVGDNGLFLCQLNCSPWDVLDLGDSNHFYFQYQQEEEEEDDDEGKGIMGNVLGFGDEEGIFGISEAFTKSLVVAAEPYFNFKNEEEEEEDGIDGKNNVRKRRRRKKKENRGVDGHENDDRYSKSSCVVTVAKSTGSSVAAGICKKNDGKGWHCSRPANPNHTLCDHHLTQLKSYSSTRYNNNNNNISAAAAESEPNATTRVVVKNHNKPDHVRSPVKHRRRKTKAVAATSVKSDGDGYYYYSGFGLGKTRSNGRKEEPKVEELAGKNESESGDGSDAPIAGDDLDDTEDDADEDDKIVGKFVDNNKGRIRRKKRGRKPIKARSLKSLM